jgi:hypothetical protein
MKRCGVRVLPDAAARTVQDRPGALLSSDRGTPLHDLEGQTWLASGSVRLYGPSSKLGLAPVHPATPEFNP